MRYKKSVLLLLLAVGLGRLAAAQAPQKTAAKLNANSVYFVDSVRLENQAALMRYDASTIAAVTIYSGPEAVALLGESGRNGAAYAETIPFARRRYWRYFRRKSAEYAALVPVPDADSAVQYVLNGKPVVGEASGNLSSIDDAIFKSLRVVDAKTLATKYGITTKKPGVLLESGVPKNLYNGKKKFK